MGNADRIDADDVVLVLTTAPDDDRAEAWARVLVEERLVACVNVHAPMVSVYRWQGAVQRDVERQLVMKTTAGRLTALRERLTALHSYDLPEFLVVRADDGSALYLQWVREETNPLAG